MLLAFLLLAAMADWAPARWNSNDPKTLDLITETPINCVLLEQTDWSAEFAEQASSRGIATLGVIRPDGDPVQALRRAAAAKLTGVVLEGDFDAATSRRLEEPLRDSRLAVVELPPRAMLRLRDSPTIVGTYQGLWPGIHVQEDGAVKAAPTGAPWIDTNTGFLRFLRAATDAAIWIDYRPPQKTVIPISRYLQAICDAALVGARWIVTLDDDFSRRLVEGEGSARKSWRQMASYLKYFEEHKEWRGFRPHSQMALIQGADSGALLSGSVLDMVASRHTPVRPVPVWRLSAAALGGARVVVNVDPASLSTEEKEVLRGFTRSGGTLLSGPPGWKFPATPKDQIMLGKDDLERLDDIWRGVQSVIGRSNLGVRVFNVSSMLTNLLAAPDGEQVVLHLVNYSGYPVESVTAYFLGVYRRARLYSPEAPAQELEVYPIQEGTGVDIPKVAICASLVLE